MKLTIRDRRAIVRLISSGQAKSGVKVGKETDLEGNNKVYPETV